nr:AAA family ATPase [Mesorhizobium sp. dw_380]
MREDSEVTLYRGQAPDKAILLLVPASAQPQRSTLERLEREHALSDQLDATWAVRPLALARHEGRVGLVFDDPGGQPLDGQLSGSLQTGHFLHVAMGLVAALRQVHASGLIHKDIKPANAFVDAAGNVRLTGFGLATRLPRERQVPAPPELIAGTLAYMSPEQTGRMNRSIDTRTDLYSLGVTFYEMLTGELPFVASEPMEWIHCHIARQPIPPTERVPTVPQVLEAIVLKLLAKAAEDRYQTIAAVESDLRQCLDSWTANARIDTFKLAAKDRPDRLRIPESLYGRASQVDSLLKAFDRVAVSGETEVVLVSGPAGVGKSSLVEELHKAMVSAPGFFAAGKFDQYKRDIPYATVAQAFQGLVRQTLSLAEADLDHRRRELLAALGPNGQLMINLIPELVLVIGEQPPALDLPPQDAQNRFHLVFQRFLGVFARPEHPLTLFIDDVQWLDAATIELIRRLAAEPDIRNLLLICAYRDNEILPSHPFARTLETMRSANRKLQDVRLESLSHDDISNLFADALQSDPQVVRPLAALVYDKTQGNPFFVGQFLTALVDEGLLEFDRDTGTWRWDVPRISSKGITDNVAELLAGRLTRLSGAALDAVKLLAYLGNNARQATLSIVLGRSERETGDALWEAILAGLVLSMDGGYAFTHDRVQEAAYLLSPEADRPATHLRIGRALVLKMTPAELQERLFEVVDQFGRGTVLINSCEECEQIAELNLRAARRARESTAYQAALAYAESASAALTNAIGPPRYRLAFDVEFLRAECEFLTGSTERAAIRLLSLSEQAANLADCTAVTCLQMALHTALLQPYRAIEIGLDYLRQAAGIDWSPHPDDRTVHLELQKTWILLGNRKIEELIDLPVMDTPVHLAVMQVLAEFLGPATFHDNNLFDLVLVRMMNLSIEHGNCASSAFAYGLVNVVVGLGFGDYRNGYRFGRLGCDLADKLGFEPLKARVYMAFGTFVLPWTSPLATARDLLVRAIAIANTGGDLAFETYSRLGFMSNLMSSGEPLARLQLDAETALDFARKAQFGPAADCFAEEILLIRELRGSTDDKVVFDRPGRDRAWFEEHLDAGGLALAAAAAKYWIHRIQACFFFQDIAGMMSAMMRTKALLWSTRSFVELIEYHFYGALALASACDAATSEQRQRYLTEIEEHRLQLQIWGEACPENWAHREVLVSAELARLEARELDAQRLYERAIQLARTNGFLPHEGIAYELAARFYAARGFETIADACLRNARSCYLHWGADAKVSQLDRLYPQLGGEPSARAGAVASGIELKHLDLAAVIEMSQAVSGEIVLHRLVERLMTTVVEHAGAVRGLLLLQPEGEMRIVAEAVTSAEGVEVHQRPSETAGELPESILNLVTRTHDVVILHDAQVPNPHSADPYIRNIRTRSILCLPLARQKQLIGILYLENNLSSYMFTPDRVSLLQILASQAAISIENAQLFLDVHSAQERERQLTIEARQSFDMIPALAWYTYPDGTLAIFNQRWHDYTGIPAEEALQGGWTRSFHPDDLEKVLAKWKTLLETGAAGEIEARIQRFDGASRTFITRATPMRDEQGSIIKWYGTNTDIDDFKRAEEAQQALARVGRLTAIGELTVSIAHEVNQPLMAIVTNAATCVQWLTDEHVNILMARQAAERIVRDGHRAGDIIASIRALAKKSPPEMGELDLNEVILEVLLLTRGELLRNGIVAETDLMADARVLGDRVQMQQVVLNLVINGIEAIAASQHQPRRLHIDTRQGDPGYLLVAVTDTGDGLDPNSSEQVFEAFFTTKPEGIGMGLSICRSIVDAHSGRLWAAPNMPSGSTFCFTVPTFINGHAYAQSN